MMLQTAIGEGDLTTGPQFLSPGLATNQLGAAFELKYHLSDAEAVFLEAWARKHLTPDFHGDKGFYRVTSVYCDTLNFDVFHKSPGYKRRKYRVRRYGDSASLYLERKSKSGDKVRKKRVEIAGHDIARLAEPTTDPDWHGAWFHQRLLKRGLMPACRISYERTAFFGQAGNSPVRMTFDRNLVGTPTNDWHVAPVNDGSPLLKGAVLLEMKYHLHLPELFRDLLPHLPVEPARMSKYRQCVHLCGLASASNRVEG